MELHLIFVSLLQSIPHVFILKSVFKGIWICFQFVTSSGFRVSVTVDSCVIARVATETTRLHGAGYRPAGGASDLVVIVLDQDLEQLVEEYGQEADDYVDLLQAQQAL